MYHSRSVRFSLIIDDESKNPRHFVCHFDFRGDAYNTFAHFSGICLVAMERAPLIIGVVHVPL